MKKAVVQVATQTTAEVFFLQTIIIFGIQEKCCIHTSHFITQNIKKMYTQGPEFNNNNNFHFFTKRLSETGIF